MEKYFEIKPDSSLYADYFAYMKDNEKVWKAVNEVREKFGIESDGFYHVKDAFWISPTENDVEKFRSMTKKNRPGEFKKNSDPSKMWVGLVKDIKHFEKPKLFYYFQLYLRWKERLFSVGEKLYCSIDSEFEFPIPEFAIEMKASEFYRIVEEMEN